MESEVIKLQERYSTLYQIFNEKQWRMYVASEAMGIGRGGIAKVSKLASVSRTTIRRGIKEIKGGDKYRFGDRIRQTGGGRKKIADIDKTLITDLEQILFPKGDPMKRILYTNKSIAKVKKVLTKKGHHIADTAIRNILLSLHYSLKPNKKNIEGKVHPDRDAQFQHINAQCKIFEDKGNPILSIDCKKKEQIGNFANKGREWTKRGKENETQVNAYDFRSLSEGIVAPYGIYDRLRKQGFINVGIDHDTAMFAVESLRRWWTEHGSKLYPQATGILITADGGGSNGVRNRLWKRELQTLVNQIQIPITLCHFPPATSKWNVIEHQLFSFISINWRAKPLTSLAVVLELISHTTTKSGLTVTAMADTNTYPIGIKVTDSEIAQLNIQKDIFHGEWNYTISPQQLDTLLE
jgi:hypothetical protein